MYLYLKALHIIFIVCWFAGLFYMPRLLIYNTEANDKTEVEKNILQSQFKIMQKRLWYGITTPSALLTLIFGPWVWYKSGFSIYNDFWFQLKLGFVLLLYGYHFSLQYLYNQQQQNKFKFSAQQLRVWNEVATLFLFAIVFLVSVKSALSFIWGLLALIAFILILLAAIKIYKQLRTKN